MFHRTSLENQLIHVTGTLHANTTGYCHSILQMTTFYAVMSACPIRTPLHTVCDVNHQLYTAHKIKLYALGAAVIIFSQSTLLLKQNDEKHDDPKQRFTINHRCSWVKPN